ncbi:MAG: 50S ribosomal protein L3 [Planctomycetes bacterium]|nr:50S ribosomal protein L3 [Planctomycetota bacterium]
MTPALLGTKIGMTRVLEGNGDAVTVTVVKAGPCVVLQRKTVETDGYEAVQLGWEDVRPHRSTMPQIGHAAKAKTGPKRFAREIRLAEPTELKQGDVVTVEQFSEGVAYVDVAGMTKGKGFAGVMKRHDFGGKEASHGVERKHRSAGGIGGSANAGMGRGVKKGKRMAGHMGDVRCTATNLRLVKTDCENGLLLIKGSVPGSNGSMVVIQKSKKKG